MPRYYFGQIVGAYLGDGKGRTKERPALIVEDDDDGDITDEILVLAITKKPSTPCPYYHIQVHSSYRKDSDTGLYYPCWVKCNWARVLKKSKITSTWGHMPSGLLESIIEAYDRLFADKTFSGWQ